MSSKNQSGFITIAIAIIIAIALLGLVSWELYSNYFNKPSTKLGNQTSSQTNSPTQQTNPPNQPTQPAQPVDPNAGYFVIKEWGVRFKPVSGLTGLVYIMRNTDNVSNTIADFTTPQVSALDPKCDPSKPNGYSGLGSISRFSTTSTQPTTGGRLLTTISSYNYYFDQPQADCAFDASNAAQTTLSNTATEFSNSIKSLEAAK